MGDAHEQDGEQGDGGGGEGEREDVSVNLADLQQAVPPLPQAESLMAAAMPEASKSTPQHIRTHQGARQRQVQVRPAETAADEDRPYCYIDMRQPARQGCS